MSVPAKRPEPRPLMDDRAPWEKQPWESNKAFRAFAIFRDLGLTRTLEATKRALGQSSNLVNDWAQRNSWWERSEQYDLEYDRRMREAKETEAERFVKAQSAGANAMMSLVLRRLVGDEDDPNVVKLHPNQLDEVTIVRMFAEAVKSGRLAHGLTTDIVKGALQITPADFQRAYDGVVERALRRIPPEQHEDFLRELMEADS